MSVLRLAQRIDDPNFIAALNDELLRMQRQIDENTAGQMLAVTTANRPDPPVPYVQIVDTTIGKVIHHDGTNWVDTAGATV